MHENEFVEWLSPRSPYYQNEWNRSSYMMKYSYRHFLGMKNGVAYTYWFETKSKQCYKVEVSLYGNNTKERVLNDLSAAGFVKRNYSYFSVDRSIELDVQNGLVFFPNPRIEFPHIKQKELTAPSDREIRELSSQAQSRYLTEFNNMRLNFVNPRVQSFISGVLDLPMIENSSSIDSLAGFWVLTESYHKGIREGNEPEYKLNVRYKLKTEGNDFIIQSCTIDGYSRFVVEFFVKYWETTLNFENVKKDEVVMNYWITDRAALSRSGAGTAKIEITEK